MDNKEKTGHPDGDLINVNEPYELKYWSDKFDITNAKLRATVNAVGTSAIKVEAYLNRNR